MIPTMISPTMKYLPIILLLAILPIVSIPAFAEPQIEVGEIFIEDEELIFNITGSGFYPDYEVYFYLSYQGLVDVDQGRTYTDQNGKFNFDFETGYGHLENGYYTIKVHELKTYEFEKYIEFGSYPENSIEWTISPLFTTEGVETIFEINGIVNFEPTNNYISFVIINSKLTEERGYATILLTDSAGLDDTGNFRFVVLIESPPAGDHMVITHIDGLVRYGTYTILPSEPIIPPQFPLLLQDNHISTLTIQVNKWQELITNIESDIQDNLIIYEGHITSNSTIQSQIYVEIIGDQLALIQIYESLYYELSQLISLYS